MNDLIKAISEIEWDMFYSTQNVGGPASCQQKPDTFFIMRTSQLSGWNEKCLTSYLQDLRDAQNAGQNLVTFKYAYMMESTYPEEYEALRDKLPPISAEKKELVDYLVERTVIWAEEFHEKYPAMGLTSRPVHKESDDIYTTSAETYMRGEAYTYSMRTLQYLKEFYDECVAAGKNLYTEILISTATQYGYPSIDAAEEATKKRLGM